MRGWGACERGGSTQPRPVGRPEAWDMISQHSFMTAEETKTIAGVLSEHPELAVDRKPDVPNTFCTYGRAAYLDVLRDFVDPERDYYANLEDANRGLRQHFGSLYDRLSAFVAELLGAEAQYAETDLALPGFHAFRGSAIALADQAGAHFDMQYRALRLPTAPDRGGKPATFTGPSPLPRTG